MFALGLPCADEEEEEEASGGLSTGAKAGIGAGVGVAAIAAIVFFAWLCFRRRKHRREAEKTNASAAPNTPAMSLSAYHDNMESATGTMDPKHVSAISTRSAHSPQPSYSQPSYAGMPYQTSMQPGIQGYGFPHAYSPTSGYMPQQQPMMPQDINQHFPQGYGPVLYPGYGTGSPPPPFYNPGSEIKPVEVDSGQPVQRVQRVTSPGASVSADAQSQGQSRAGDGSVVELGTESMSRSQVSR